MEGGHEGYSVDGLLLATFLFEDFRSGERTNFVNGLLDCPGTMASGTEMSLQITGMVRKVRVLGADAAKSESLTVGDAGFAVAGMAAG